MVSTFLIGAAQPQQPTTSGFGAATTSFGAVAPSNTFGASNTSAFGGGVGLGGAPSTFGGGGVGSAFGVGSTSTIGAGGGGFGVAGASTGGVGTPGQTNATTNCGTGNPPYTVTQDKENAPNGQQGSVSVYFQSISCMPNYKNWNFEVIIFILLLFGM